ncbi:caspase family protein, partial [Myxococcota bacterium]|nr:caspase family protein [Myxococcota bacterium]
MKLSRKSMVFTFFVSLFVLLTGASVADAKPALRRFALIVGANNGGAERVLLRYAVSDARAFSEVLHTLGGVAPGDSLILLNPDKSDFISGFDRLGELVERGQGSADRTEVVVYYSGHSDEQGLLLGEHRLKYSWLRRHLKRLGADVRIVVLDSCSSGALTRRKGGTLLPPFVLDTSSKVSGHAFITSSSATEAAQESDAIAGSFFTHYLVSGLRGAADTNGDGRVTLTEAYQFAFDETLARTESTQSGPQHPNYDFQLAGAGNLVMTDLSTSTARLMLDASLTGRVSVRDSDGHLVAELRKMQGKVVSLGLSPGRYQVSITTTQGLLGGTIDIKAGHLGHLGEMTLESIDLERAVPRGGLLEKELGLSEEYEVQEMCLGLFPGFGTCPGLRKKVIRKTSLSLFWDHAERIDGLQASAIVSVATEDLSGLQASAVANLNGGALDGVQLAGAVNLTRGSAIGIQGAGAVNVLVGSLRGA